MNADVGNREDRALQTCRHAYLEDGRKVIPVDTDLRDIDMYDAVFLSQIVEQQHGAYHVCQDCRYGDPVHIHPQNQNEEKIRSYVKHASDEEADERSPCVAVAAENCGLKVVKHYERRAAEIKPEVGH